VFHTPRFATASGKAKFHAVQVPGLKGASADGVGKQNGGDEVEVGSALRLMTIRSEGQFNTVVYEEEDVYRHQERRDVILMNELDIQRLKLKVDERVTVRSQTGEMRGILVRSAEIRAGNAAMYYPESNVLVSRSRDNESKTPSFKNTIVWVEKARSLYVLGRVLEVVK
jgi:anaerobic selenocysteine-containing dehydrogenase